MLSFMNNNKKSLIDSITSQQKLGDDLEKELRDALNEFNKQYGVDKPAEETVTA